MSAVAYEQPFTSIGQLKAISVPTVVIPGANEMHPRNIGVAYADAMAGAPLADEDTAQDAIEELLAKAP